jgi:CheY-like chemotaxis protein
MESPDSKPCVLLADDSEDDIFFARYALEQSGIAWLLHVLGDGREAVNYLSGAGEYANRKKYPLPSVLILDIKMPRLNGFQVLAWARSQPKFRALPIIVLSTSALESDVAQAQQLGATAFKTKPAGLQNVVTLFQEIHERWLAPSVTIRGKSLPRAATRTGRAARLSRKSKPRQSSPSKR